MDYPQTIEYLFTRLPLFSRIGAAAYKSDLINIQTLSKELGNPENKFRSIHVAGTNGKGSSSHMLAAILQKAGYKTGLYTSPHLHDFRERIRIDGLSFDSDFKAFMHSKVEDAVKRAALKKLFSDPRFNVMDGLDTYIDDYTKAEPISEELLARIEQVREQLLAPPVPDDEAEEGKPSEGIPEEKTQVAAATQENVDPAQNPKAL